MKTHILLALLFGAVALFSGCQTRKSPISVPARTGHTSLREGVTLAAATGAGAAAGRAITGDSTGAAIGAGVGLVAGALTNNMVQTRTDQHDAEVAEEARRAERLKIMGEFWEGERYHREQSTSGSGAAQQRTVHYPGGTFEGVNLAPRTASSDSALGEPARP